MRRLYFFLFIVCFLAAENAAASESVTYASLAEGIATAQGRGEAEVNKGRFVGRTSQFQFAIINKRAAHVTYVFDYKDGGVDSASIAFREGPIVVVLRQNDTCVVVEIRKITIRPGGFLDTPASDFKPVSHPECRNPANRLASSAAELFSLPQEPNNFFRFRWFGWQDSIRKCNSDACNQPSSPGIANFFKDVRFFPSEGKPGFSASLVERTSVALGRGDFLIVGTGGKVEFTTVRIVPADKDVTARLKDLSLPLESGQITTPALRLFLDSGSAFRASNMSITGQNDTLTVENGTIEGSASSGSTVTIDNGAGNKPSVITFARASVKLVDINLTVENSKVTFSARTGEFRAGIQSADLQIGPAARVLVGAADVNVRFRCPAGSPADCRPITAGTGQPLVSMGEIEPLNLTTQNGFYDIPNVGTIRLERGELVTGLLTFDSRKPKTPVSGNIQKLDMTLAAQMLRLDTGFQVQAFSGRLAGEDLVLSQRDGLPVGELRVDAQIGEFLSEGLGRIATIKGSSTLSGLLRRVDQGDVHLLDGRIEAQITAATNGGNASANLRLTDLNLVRGNGSALFSLTIPQINYAHFVPGKKETFDPPVVDVDVTINEQTLSASLVQPIVMTDRKVQIRSNRWSVESTTFPVKARLSLSRDELVYAVVKDDVLNGTICTSKVKVPFTNYLASFDGTLRLTDGRLGFTNSPFVIDPYPNPEIDGRACKDAVTIICGMVGAALGPIGAVGAAYLCRNEFEEGEEKLQANINRIVADGIRSIRFDAQP